VQLSLTALQKSSAGYFIGSHPQDALRISVCLRCLWLLKLSSLLLCVEKCYKMENGHVHYKLSNEDLLFICQMYSLKKLTLKNIHRIWTHLVLWWWMMTIHIHKYIRSLCSMLRRRTGGVEKTGKAAGFLGYVPCTLGAWHFFKNHSIVIALGQSDPPVLLTTFYCTITSFIGSWAQ
jgi:hypothetical protein